jgi:hypothetical protein
MRSWFMRAAAAAVLCAACQRGESDPPEADPPRADPAPATTAAALPEPPADRNQGSLEPVAIAGRYQAAPWLAEARRVAALRSGDGVRVVSSGLGWLRLHRPDGSLVAEVDAVGVAHTLTVADVDGDGAADLIVGRGRGRDALDAPAAVHVFLGADLSRPAEVVPLPATTRAEVIDLVAVPGAPGRLWLGMFVSKYLVDLLEARRGDDGTWTVTRLGQVRVAVDLAAGDVDGDGQPELIVARPYGETLEADGGVFVLRDGERQPVPSRRGARAVVALPRADGPAALVFTDGWHREYGARAQALVSLASPGEAGWDTRILTHVRDRHGYDRLVTADTDGDGRLEVVAAGHGPAILVDPAAAGPQAAREIGSAAAHDAYAFDLDGDGADEIIVAGDEPGIWRRAKSR